VNLIQLDAQTPWASTSSSLNSAPKRLPKRVRSNEVYLGRQIDFQIKQAKLRRALRDPFQLRML